MRIAPALILVASIGCVDAAAGELVNENCNADLVCLSVFKGNSVDIFLESKTHKPLSFKLFVNASEVRSLDLDTHELDGPARMRIASFATPDGRWGYEYRVHYGHARHEHDDGHVYRLPYAVGSSYLVSQSSDALSTHHEGNRYAIDWSMPVGEGVHAARAGTVVSTYSASAASGPGTSGNHVWIRHSDGTIGKYLHLAHEAVFVVEGERIAAGQRIAESGNTGFSSGPHLHFSVSTLNGENLYETFNVRFATDDGPTTLTSARRYAHPVD